MNLRKKKGKGDDAPTTTTTSHFPFPEKEKLSSSAPFLFLLLPLIWSVSPHFAAQESPRELEVGSAHLIRKRKLIFFADFEKKMAQHDYFPVCNCKSFVLFSTLLHVGNHFEIPNSRNRSLFFVSSTRGTKAGKEKKCKEGLRDAILRTARGGITHKTGAAPEVGGR